jgi:hypothetical protein
MFSGAKDVVKIEVCISGSGAITGLEYYDCVPPTSQSSSGDAPFTADFFSAKTADIRDGAWFQDSLSSSNPTSQPSSAPGRTSFSFVVTIAAGVIFLLSCL